MTTNTTTKDTHLTLRIEKMTYKGAGIARTTEGLVVFVPNSAPGDLVKVQLRRQKKNHAEGEILELLEKGPSRVDAPCPYYKACGGCNWQHIDYKSQVNFKTQILTEICEKNFSNAPLPMIGSPETWNYRNRIQLKYEMSQLGFYSKRSHQLVPIQECLIADKKINVALKSWLASPPSDLIDNEQIRFQLNPRNPKEVQVLRSTVGTDEPGFSQVNQAQNTSLQDLVIKQVIELAPELIMDLYGGSGNFALPLAKALRLATSETLKKCKIESVELNLEAHQLGKELVHNLDKKDSTKYPIRWIHGDVGQYLKRLSSLPSQSLVLLDPPRGGINPDILRALAWLKPAHLIYISCDPMTWTRDVQLLKLHGEKAGSNYSLQWVQGFDMFPHTDHIELASLLKLEK